MKLQFTCPHKNACSTRDGAKRFTKYYFHLKINVPCIEIMKTYCFEVNLNFESLSNCNFCNEIFFLILFIILGKIYIKTKKKEIISTFFYVIESLEWLIYV